MEPTELVYLTLDHYLDKLDTVTVSETGFFKTDHEKEHYETIFMYSFRKYRAAVYHSNLINKFLIEYVENAQTNPLREIKDDETFTTNICYTADHFAFELSAFLESLKSSVDFLATNCSFHIPRIQCKSISTLLKRAKDENERDPIFDVIRQNQKWLDELRIYRHHFVHFRFNSTSCGYKRQVIKGAQKIFIYPVIIPQSPPPYVPDTRRYRAEEKSPFLNYRGGFTQIKNNNDGKKNIFMFYPPLGYITIEDFIEVYLNSYQKFFTELMQTLSDLDFQKSNFS